MQVLKEGPFQYNTINILNHHVFKFDNLYIFNSMSKTEPSKKNIKIGSAVFEIQAFKILPTLGDVLHPPKRFLFFLSNF